MLPASNRVSDAPGAFEFHIYRTRRAEDGTTSRLSSSGSMRLEFLVGDLTEQDTDVIVSPSDRGLSGGGLVDLAIRRVAGPELVVARRTALQALRGGLLSPGQAVLTAGFRLRARHVVHCVPPVYEAARGSAREQLAACYVEALRLVRANGLRSIAFPAIGTGAYGYPTEEAARVAVATVVEQLRAHEAPSVVKFVLYGPSMLQQHLEAARTLLHQRADL